jgi:tetratricopeptide (TPR) repeat protein
MISFLVFRWGKLYPYLTVGWLWFLGTLFPTIGLIQVGFHAMADRYTYLPLTGLFIMIVWGGSAVAAQWRRGTAPVSLIALILIFILMIDARAQVRHWQNSITLFSHAIKVTEQNYLAHNNLGCALMDRRDYAGAAHHYAATVRIRPNDAGPENNLGNALLMQRRMEEALFHYREAIRKEPNGVDAERNLGNALMKMKKPGPAVLHYRRALTLEPDNAELHNNLGVALFNVGDHEGAILHTREALRLRRDYADARRNMEIMLGAAGKR